MEVKDIPLGYVFRPTTLQLTEYLRCKVESKPLPVNGVILDLDPYDPKQLPDIFSSVMKRDDYGLYVFTKLRKKRKLQVYPRPSRKVGNGIWHPEKTVLDEIQDDNRCYYGYAQKLCYREKGSKYDRKILMMEYTLNSQPPEYDPYRDFVLCHIVRMKGRRKSYDDNDALEAARRCPSPCSDEWESETESSSDSDVEP